MRSLLIIVMLALVSVTLPRDAAGQDCGMTCLSCGWHFYEGVNMVSHDGTWNASCSFSFIYCDYCSVSVGDEGLESAEGVALDVMNALPRPGIAEEVVRRHHGRLFIDIDRDVLMVSGGGSCDAATVMSVTFLTASARATLLSLGVPTAFELPRQTE